jgi:hypothetical protein
MERLSVKDSGGRLLRARLQGAAAVLRVTSQDIAQSEAMSAMFEAHNQPGNMTAEDPSGKIWSMFAGPDSAWKVTCELGAKRAKELGIPVPGFEWQPGKALHIVAGKP